MTPILIIIQNSFIVMLAFASRISCKVYIQMLLKSDKWIIAKNPHFATDCCNKIKHTADNWILTNDGDIPPKKWCSRCTNRYTSYHLVMIGTSTE